MAAEVERRLGRSRRAGDEPSGPGLRRTDGGEPARSDRPTRCDRAIRLPQETRSGWPRCAARSRALEKQLAEPIPAAHGAPGRRCAKDDLRRTHDARIQVRGSYARLGEAVPRRFPAHSGRRRASSRSPRAAAGLQLARWLASADNPLTARVMVNRIWQHHFGEGIVRSANNFGKLGERPTHPELLDYLADRFVKLGWSIKALHREIMLSATYQQSSIGDADAVGTRSRQSPAGPGESLAARVRSHSRQSVGRGRPAWT